MGNNIFAEVPALILRIVAVSFLYVVNIFYSSYKYNRKMSGHYTSLKVSIQLGVITGIGKTEEFCKLFETITSDKIEFDEGKSLEKALDMLKRDGKKEEKKP